MSGSRHLEAARLIEWACRLVRFPSPQTALFERDPQVQAFLSGPVVEVLEECGLGWRRDAMGNLIVEIAGRGDGPSLMLMGYAMTHPANRMERPFDGELIEGGRRLRGRGLAEQKEPWSPPSRLLPPCATRPCADVSRSPSPRPGKRGP